MALPGTCSQARQLCVAIALRIPEGIGRQGISSGFPRRLSRLTPFLRDSAPTPGHVIASRRLAAAKPSPQGGDRIPPLQGLRSGYRRLCYSRRYFRRSGERARRATLLAR